MHIIVCTCMIVIIICSRFYICDCVIVKSVVSLTVFTTHFATGGIVAYYVVEAAKTNS